MDIIVKYRIGVEPGATFKEIRNFVTSISRPGSEENFAVNFAGCELAEQSAEG